MDRDRVRVRVRVRVRDRNRVRVLPRLWDRVPVKGLESGSLIPASAL